jgi:hypothetical protein
MPDPIPEEVKRFLVDYIDSIAELEIVLFLREHRNRSYFCSVLADHIYSTEELTADLLVKLVRKGLLTSDGVSPASFSYKPHNQETTRLLDQLAEAYAKYLVPVTNLVHKKSRRNIESLSQAFDLKRKN